MIKKLLNKKNLIIILIMAFIGIFCMQTPVYAATTFSDYLREAVLGIFEFGRNVCVIALFIITIACFAYMFIAKTPTATELFKRTLLYILVGLIVIVFLAFIIAGMLELNDIIIKNCVKLGRSISQIDDEYNETTMYDEAISQAYEIKATAGFTGMFLYIILVYYCVKFFIVYLRRYINVMILIIVSPWVITKHVVLKTFRGTGGKIGLWVKEMIFNIYIQSLHAIAYAALIGLTLRLSGSALSLIGVILTLIVFSFMSSIEGLLRRIFNMVGGSSSVKSFDIKSAIDFAKHPVKNTEKRANSAINSIKQIPANISEGAINFKNNAGAYFEDISSAIQGNNIEVTAKEVKEQQEKMNEHPNVMKLENAVKETGRTVKNGVNNVTKNVKIYARKISDYSSQELQLMRTKIIEKGKRIREDVEIVKSISRYFRHYKDRQIILNKVSNGTATPEELECATQFNDLDDLSEDVSIMKNAIDKSNNLTGTLYELKGSSLFILQAGLGGSSHLGLMMIESSMELEKTLNSEEAEENKQYSKTITIVAPKYVNETSTEEGKKKKNANKSGKKYSFKEFSSGAVNTIINQVMLQTLLQDVTVFSLIKFRAKMNETDIVPVGVVEIKGTNSEDVEVVSGDVIEEHKTIIYKSKTTKNSLIELQAQRANSINNYKERAKDNNWVSYVNSNKNATKLMNEQVIASGSRQDRIDSTMREQSSVSENERQDQQYDRRENMFSGVVVATAMKNNIALENVDVRNDLNLQDDFITNLSRYGIVPEEAKTDDAMREQAIQQLEDKIHSLTTDDKETYYNMVVDFSERAEEAGIEISGEETNNIKNEEDNGSEIIEGEYKEVIENSEVVDESRNKKKRKNMFTEEEQNGEQEKERQKQKQKQKVSGFGKEIELTDFVEDVVDGEYREIHEGNSIKEIFESKTGREFNSRGYIDTVIKAIVEETAEQVKKTANEKIDEFAKLVDELANNATEETKETVENDITEDYVTASYRTDTGKKSKRKNEKEDKNKKDNYITFYVYGEVITQGKYVLKALPKGRYYTIETAIEAAGWVTEDADLSKINLESILEDEMIIRVPKKPDSIDVEEEERECEKVVNRIIASYIAKENIKDYSVLRERENERNILKQVKKELEDTDDDLIKGLMEKRVKELETADRDVFSKSEEEQKTKARGYRNAQRENETNKKMQQVREQLAEEEQNRVSEEMVNNALEELTERKAIVIESGANQKSNARVQEARKIYMDNDALKKAV